MTWFSTVLREPAIGYATLFGLQSLGGITSVIRQEGSGSGTNQWLAYDLLDAYELLELDLESRTGSRYQQGIPDFQLGFQQDGTSLVPTWEAGNPLALQVVAEIYNKSLDELDSYIQDMFREAEAVTVAEA